MRRSLAGNQEIGFVNELPLTISTISRTSAVIGTAGKLKGR